MTSSGSNESGHLVRRTALIGLVSGVGAGVALLAYSRLGFAAMLGDVGFHLMMLGAGWFTGQAFDKALPQAAPSPAAERDRLVVGGGFALAYAAGVGPLNTLLVEVSLTGDWLLPSLWLGAVAALLGGLMAWAVARHQVSARPIAAAAVAGVVVLALVVLAVNAIVWAASLGQGGGGPSALMLIGVWAIYLVPALWLPPVTYFCLKPLAKER